MLLRQLITFFLLTLLLVEPRARSKIIAFFYDS